MPAEPPVNLGFVVISNNGISDTVDLPEAVTIGMIQKINESKVGFVRTERNPNGINIVSLDDIMAEVMDREGR